MIKSHELVLGLLATAALVSAGGCSRAGGATDAARTSSVAETATAAERPKSGKLDAAGRVERFRLSGKLDEFVAEALRTAEERPDDAAVWLHKTEALLAIGRHAEAEQSAVQAAELALAAAKPTLAAHAMRLWATARFRQGRSLAEPTTSQHLEKLASDEHSAQMLRFWGDALGDRPPYRLDSASDRPADLPMAEARRGSLAFELAAVQVATNGTRQPLVFIDTGAQNTLMTTSAAQAAGVRRGSAGTHLTGFVGLEAQPAVIQTLALGELVLHDVPVLVGDWPPLVTAGGQMSLGTDLMHHVRFTIDYPARRVTVAPAESELPPNSQNPLWEIPLWTFSQVALARGATGDGTPLRVLVDTGDRAGTYLSHRWGRRHLAQLAGPNSALVFRYKKRNLTLDVLQLGSQSLVDWPILDTMPAELDRLNLVDVIAGHDLLWPYQLTIDMRGRRLLLHAGPSTAGEQPENGGETDAK